MSTDAPPAAPAPVWRFRLAFAIALCADLAQIAFLPLFSEGFASPLDDALDVATGAALVWLVGFHWVLIPSMFVEAMPVVDVAPAWTLAVLFIQRQRRALPAPPRYTPLQGPAD